MSFIDWQLANPTQPAQIPSAGVLGAQQGYQLGQQGAMYSALRNVDLGNIDSVNRSMSGLARIGMADQAKALSDLAVTRAQNSAALPYIPGITSGGLQRAKSVLDRLNGATPAAQAAAPQQAPTPQLGDPTQPPAAGTDRTAAMQAKQQQLMQEAASATQDLLNYKGDPALREAAAATYRQHFAQEGVPQGNIDEVLGDLSDAGLQAHNAYFQDQLSGGSGGVAHPTNFAASRSALGGGGGPGYDQATDVLNSGVADPFVQAAIAKYGGLDLKPGIDTALSITGPARNAAASAPYTKVDLPGPQGQDEVVSAQNFATGQSAPDAQPIVGATPYSVSSQQAAGTAPYHDVTVTGPQGQPEVMSATQFARGRGAPTTPGGPPGPEDAPPIVGPTLAQRGQLAPVEVKMPDGSTQLMAPTQVNGQTQWAPIQGAPGAGGGGAPPTPIGRSPSASQAQGLIDAARANTAAAATFEASAAGYPLRKANLENMMQSASTISTGPQSGFWGHLGALAAEYGVHTPFTPTSDQTVAYEEVRKMARAVLAQQQTSSGLPNTNQSTSLMEGAVPGEETSPAGIQRLGGILVGNEDYGNAARQAWQTWKQNSHGYETFNDFVPQFNKLFDPRVFQAQYMDPAQRAIVIKDVGARRFNLEETAAKRLGWIGNAQ